MKNGFRVYDSDTHINPAAEILDKAARDIHRPRLEVDAQQETTPGG